MYESDSRIVLTLDAGGTNLVFSAMAANREIVAPVHFPSCPDNLDRMLSTLVGGFKAVRRQLPTAPAAISFAFPGPADYANGVIGDLPNFPSFRGGVALGPYLERHFGIPVFINNDGNLFAYGEAILRSFARSQRAVGGRRGVLALPKPVGHNARHRVRRRGGHRWTTADG